MELLYLHYGVQAAACAFSQKDTHSTERGHAGEALRDLKGYLEAIETPARKVGGWGWAPAVRDGGAFHTGIVFSRWHYYHVSRDTFLGFWGGGTAVAAGADNRPSPYGRHADAQSAATWQRPIAHGHWSPHSWQIREPPGGRTPGAQPRSRVHRSRSQAAARSHAATWQSPLGPRSGLPPAPPPACGGGGSDRRGGHGGACLEG